MRCLRCASEREDVIVFGAIRVCKACLLLIVREWLIKNREFGELVK